MDEVSVTNASTGWAITFVVLLPLVVVGLGEFSERLRQHRSPFVGPVRVLQLWIAPALAALVLVTQVLGRDADTPLFRVLASMAVLGGAVWAVMVLRVVVRAIVQRPVREGRRRPPQLLLALPRLVVLVVAFWLLLHVVWGVDLTGVFATLGVTGIIISLALQGTLSGLASGLMLLSDSPFEPGDWIAAADIEGRVVDINWRSTRIQTRDGDVVVVPNAQLAEATVVNFDRPTRLHRVTVPVQVAFSNPPTAVIDMMRDAAQRTPHVLTDPSPNVKITQIDDPLMEYTAELWVDDYRRAPQVRSDFRSLVWYWSHRRQIGLPSPAQDLYLWDGVREAAGKIPAHEDLRRHLLVSPLLQTLPAGEVDRLAGAARLLRFARGEQILIGDGRGDLYVVTDGVARWQIGVDTDDVRVVAELRAGEMFGLTGIPTGDLVSELVANSDCEVVVVDADEATTVISRNAPLAAALNRVVESRRRRVDRLLVPAAEPDAPGDVVPPARRPAGQESG